MKLFMAKKEQRRTWAEQLLFMVAVSDTRGGADSLVLGKIVHHASPKLMNVMRAKNDSTRFDYLRRAEKLAHFAQPIELGSGSVGCCGVCRNEAPRYTNVLPLRQDGARRVRLQGKVHV